MLQGEEIERFVALAYGISGIIMLFMLFAAVSNYRRVRAALRAFELTMKQP